MIATDTALNGISWMGTPISLVGAYLVAADKNRLIGFSLLLVADFMFAGILTFHSIWSQVVILAVYAIMNGIGIWKALKRNG